MNRLLIGRIAGALVGAVLIAGCAASGEPMPSASPASARPATTLSPATSSSPAAREWQSASPAPVEAPAGLPSIGTTDTIQGGVAVAIAFIEEHPRLFQEGPSELFAFLSMPECEYCAYEQDRAQRERAEIGMQVGGEMVVDHSEPYFKLDTEEFGEPTLTVVLDVYERSYTFVNPAGEVTRSGDGQDLRAGVALQLRDGIWRVLGFLFEKVKPVAVPQDIRDMLDDLRDA